jgi:hypothetical protein
MKNLIITCALLVSMLSLAHEGHDAEGMSKAETLKQTKAGKLCMHKNQGYSMGAIIEQDKKLFRCVKAYNSNLEAHSELVWIELALKNKVLVTLP